MTTLTPNASYSVALHLELLNRAEAFAAVTQAIASVGGNLGGVTLEKRTTKIAQWEIIVDASSTQHAEQILEAIKALADVKILSFLDRTFDIHRNGKISIESRLSLTSQSDLAMAYTPGVGRICKAIEADPERVFELTIKGNTVAVVTDGSAVLGLGNLGPEAALPVMEGKALLFKEFADIDAFPICLDTQDTEEIIKAVKYIAPVFGGINLEDIGSPRCFEIEKRLRAELNIPVFHDDQHGTAIVCLAALINSLKVVKKSLESVKILISGAGAAGIAVANLLRTAGAKNIWMCDIDGIVSQGRSDLTPEKIPFAVATSGTLTDAIKGADVFIGVSAPNILTPAMVATMNRDQIVFAMANPVPEIQPELIINDVAIVATGRSDYPNQINNVLAFPGLFRGALDCRATSITENMYLEAAKAIASLIEPTDLNRENIIPSVFDPRVATVVAEAVKKAAHQDGVASL